MKSTLAITFVTFIYSCGNFDFYTSSEMLYRYYKKKRITDYYYLTLVYNNLDVNLIFSKEYTKIVVINPLICLI